MRKKRFNNATKLLFITIILLILVGVGASKLLRLLIHEGVEAYVHIAWTGVAILACVGILLLLECILTIQQAHDYDVMTGIHNNVWILRRGGMLYARKKLHAYHIIFMNIRDCKFLNQKVGNENGDELIRTYSHILREYLKKKGYIGRMGGDNFLIFVRNEYLNELLEFLDTIYVDREHDGHPLHLHILARCGIVKANYEVCYRELIGYASVALAMAKTENLSYVFFREEMQNKMIHDKELLSCFPKGLEKEEFLAYYQPKVDLRTGSLCGAEALARWKLKGKMVPPVEFIPLLEKEGVIQALDFYIFERVCRDLRRWLDEGKNPVRISTNFSKLHLLDPDFAKKVLEIKNKYQLDGCYLEVELTESVGAEDFQLLREFSKQMKIEGIQIAIDDFGTGYSSLSTLRNYDADVIKLDKSFLDSASENDPASQIFFRDIVGLIHHQGETILCEGVETEKQLEFLRAVGCNIIQGFYFDKPLPGEEFEKRLDNPHYTI